MILFTATQNVCIKLIKFRSPRLASSSQALRTSNGDWASKDSDLNLLDSV